MRPIFSFLLAILILASCTRPAGQSLSQMQTATDGNGYVYSYVTGDPSGARIYTLDNGLKVFLAVNKDRPRINTLIAVNAGAKNDPRETTGLAHYFEHMMFKGSTKIATTDWESESKYIAEISDLFEQHAAESDPVKKKAIYAKIDSVSQIASKYAVANEYDKICSLIGATGTNAWTSYEETVYVNNIPSNEVERWIKTERERFENLVLRLFHTELETIFEEFNMGQDNVYRRVNKIIMSTLFKKHPYGMAVIGLPEHIKNPSMVNVMNFKKDFYVPNNMAICMSGDLDFEATVKMIDSYWGDLKANPDVPKFSCDPEDERAEVQKFDVFGPEAEFLSIAYRTPGNKSKESRYLTMISEILNNGKAGLIDLDLNKKQLVQSAYAYNSTLNDYGIFELGGSPRIGQSLEEVEKLLLDEIEKVKNGDFDTWLMEAIINKMKIDRIRSVSSGNIAYRFVDCFISGKPWNECIFDIEEMEKITKSELVDFANDFFKDNYVTVYKRMGVDTTIFHIEKPEITPLDINRTAESEYFTQLKEMPVQPIEPQFVDFDEQLRTEDIANGVQLNYIENTTNDMFDMQYILDMGKDNDKLLPIAVGYLQYLGTTDKSIDSLQKEWFRMGVDFSVSVGSDANYVRIAGLDEQLEPAMKLVEEILANVQADTAVYQNYVDKIIKRRHDDKLDKDVILWNGLMNYSKYGPKSSFTDILSEDELRNLDPQKLVDIIKNMFNYKHKILYYGPSDYDDVVETISAIHPLDREFKDIPAKTEYPEVDYDEPEVLFVNYDMVQTMLLLASKDVPFDKNLMAVSSMFNEYYGGSMSSIVFQEIREAKSLAYGCAAGYSQANEKDKSNYLFGFLSTQPDKMTQALDAMTDLLSNMAVSENSFNLSKDAIIKQMNTSRIINTGIFWHHESLRKLGIDYDIRKDIYNEVKDLTINDIQKFFDEHFKNKHYDILIVGNKSNIDFNVLAKYGKVKELSLEEIFNY